MDVYKLRVKLGPHEFEAEGPKDAVISQFEAWKELIGSAGPKFPPAVTEVRTREGYSAPWDIFDVDEKRKLITLRVHPTGDTRNADAVLLTLYGYRQTWQQNETPVTRIKESLEVSGLRPGRIDRMVAPSIQSGLLIKTGHGKGGKYRLTNTGFTRADELARVLFEKIA